MTEIQKSMRPVNEWDKVINIGEVQIVIRRQLPNMVAVGAEIDLNGEIIDINKLFNESDLRIRLNDIIEIINNDFGNKLSTDEIKSIAVSVYREFFGNED